MKRILTFCVMSLAVSSLVVSCAKKNISGTTDTTAKTTTAAAGNTDANKATMQRFYDEVMNQHKVDALDQLVSPDFVDHNPGPGQQPGMAGLKKSFNEMYTAFPDMNAKVDHYVADGDMVTAVGTMSGTMKGDMGTMKATNKHFTATMLDAVRFKDGKAVERWGAMDDMAMMSQLGFGPPPEPKKKM